MGSLIDRRAALGTLVGLGVGVALSPARVWAADPKPPTFTLEDQWERKHDQSVVFRGGNVVLVGGDQRATGDRIAEWLRALGDGLTTWGIVDLDAVPFFVPRGSIRSNLRSVSPKIPILLDWNGKVYGPVLGFPTKREIVVQVHGPAAQLLARVEGTPTPDRVSAVRKAAGV